MKKLILSLVFAAMPILAHAGTVTTATVTQGPANTDFEFRLSIDKYNGPQPLQSVEIFMSTHVVDTDLTLTNGSSLPQTFTFKATVDTLVSSSPLSAFNGLVTSPNTILDTGFVTFSAGESRSYGPIDKTFLADSGASTIASDLAAVTGIGTFDISGRTLSGTSFLGGGGNITLNQAQKATISAYAVYTYANAPTIPEPSTLALLGLGSVGFAVVARRRHLQKD